MLETLMHHSGQKIKHSKVSQPQELLQQDLRDLDPSQMT